MANAQIAVFTHATVAEASDRAVAAMAAAVQTQVHRDFAASWHIDADLTFFPAGQRVPPGLWQVGVFDNSDQAGALGYHDVTRDGLPLGKVFARSTIMDGGQVSVTLSHEALEMLADPDINLTAFVESPSGGGRLYAYETCDAVEADALGYSIDGIAVSDFVTPAWFQSFRKKGSTDFSFMKRVHKPFELTAGGYIGYYDVLSGSGWQQLTARGEPDYRARPPRGSRRERRRTPRSQWMESTA